MLEAFGAETERNIAEQICDLLGRMPLAIRLAGRFLADSKHNSHVFLDWLTNHTELPSLTPGERQKKSIELMLAHTLAQVNETARQSLAVASLMAFALFDPEIIAKVLTIQPNQGLFSTIRGLFRQDKQVQSIPYVMQSLRELVGYGLLDWTPDGYIFSHPAIYAYARTHLSPPAHAIRRLATLYMAMAWEQGEAGNSTVNLLGANRPHIMKIMEECVTTEEWAAAHGLAAAVEDFLDRHGYLGDRVIVNEVGLIAAWQLGRPSEGAWLGNLGDTYRTMGHAKWAIEHFEKALATAQQAGDRHAEGNSLGNLGLAYRDLGQIEQAVKYLKQAEAIFEEIHSPSAGLVKDWLTELEEWEEE
jgi:tetratricopeptide (TPR) repeat protein